MYKVLICGSRTFHDELAIRAVIQNLKAQYYPKGTLRIIEGAAAGADTLAGCIAEELGLEVVEYPANWELHGRAAGVIRNTLMLENELPDLVIAFANVMPVGAGIPLTPGTQDMVVKAIRAGVPVQIHIPRQESASVRADTAK